jgi:hypothetical protein
MNQPPDIETELRRVTKQIDALPRWRRSAIDRAREAEKALGYIQTPKATMQKPARCRFCGRPWSPARGVVVSTAYCSACSLERWEAARKRFSKYRLEAAGKYLVRTKWYRSASHRP